MNLFPTDHTGLDDGRVGTKVRQRDVRCMMYGVIPYQRDPDVERVARRTVLRCPLNDFAMASQS